MIRKSALSAFLFSLIFFAGCKQKEDFDILGTWRANVVLEQQLASQSDEDTVIATVKISQENILDFKEDGSFSRTLKSHFIKANIFSADISEEQLRALYEDSVSVLDGRFKISGDVLSLFAENTPATQFKLEADENGRILFQGVAFSRM
jgi:hypothetical protein